MLPVEAPTMSWLISELQKRNLCKYIIVLIICYSGCLYQLTICSKVKLIDNGYRGIVVAVSPDVPKENLNKVLEEIEQLLQDASVYLTQATQFRAFFEDVTILLAKNADISSIKRNVSWDESTYVKFSDADVLIQDRNNGPFSLHGEPFTLQYGGCGQPGKYIHVPTRFLLDPNAEKIYGQRGHVFIHEWAHYRYGVFDENGFPGDDLYPAVYAIPNGKVAPNDTRPNACTNEKLEYEFSPNKGACQLEVNTGKPSSKECFIRPVTTEGSVNEKIVSSIMYQQALLKNVAAFCDNSNHIPSLPTKHNAICQEKSTWDVINNSQDLKSNLVVKRQNISIKFQYVTEQVLRIAVAVDVRRSETHSKHHLPFIRQGWYNFVMLLPTGSQVSLLSYGYGEPSDVIFRKVLNGYQDKNRVGNDALNLVSAGTSGEFCFSCVINKAVQILDVSRESGHRILMLQIDGSSLDTVTEIMKGDEMESTVKLLLEKKICLYVMIYPTGTNHNVFRQLEQIAEATQGKVYYVEEQVTPASKDGSVHTLVDIYKVFEDITRGYSALEVNSILLKQELFVENQVQFAFQVDQSLSGCDVAVDLIGVSVESLAEGLSGVSLRSPSGVDYGTAKPSGNIVHENIRGSVKSQFKISSIQDSGEWKLSATIRGNSPFVAEATALCGSESRLVNKTDDPITLDCWINRENTKQIDFEKDGPLTVYANVHRGIQPIRGTKVALRVFGPNEEMLMENDLIDDGAGDPDITKWDGIYSSYVTKLNPNGGYHRLEITAEGNEITQVVKQRDISGNASPIQPGLKHCCGSAVPVEASVPTGKFVRKTVCGSVFVKPFSPEKIIMAPSRITDLRLKNVDASKGSATLQWTAPGGEGSMGQADEYEMKFSPNRNTLRDSFDELTNVGVGAWLLHGKAWDPPQKYGNLEERVINLQELIKENAHAEEKIFLAVRAVKTPEFARKNVPRGAAEVTSTGAPDIKRVFGQVSNIVEIDMREMPWYPTPNATDPAETTTGATNSTIQPATKSTGKLSKGEIAALSVGIFLLLLIIIALILFCILVVIPRRKERKRKSDLEAKNNRQKEIEIIRGTATTTVPTINAEKNSPERSSSSSSTGSSLPDKPMLKDDEKGSGNILRDQETMVSPVYWPANVLMQHYDRVQEAKMRNAPPPIMTEDDLKEMSPSYASKTNSLYHRRMGNRSAPTAPPLALNNQFANNKTASDSNSVTDDESVPPVPPPPVHRRNVTAV